MCGIAGLLAFDPAVVQTSRPITAMRDALTHRGPDGAGVWMGGPVALGHRRLAIVDVDGGHQPMSNDDGSAWITYNGECYNYRALAARLRSRGHRFRSTSDTEVILRLYEEKGEAFLDELRAAGVELASFDAVYDTAASIDDVYRDIVEQLVAAANVHGAVAYGVPGSPLVAERTVEMLDDAAREGRIELTVVPGVSFADLAWTTLRVDPMRAGARMPSVCA